ncbi:uncharacterized protein LOC112904456 isoform X2 [Agrilus planipennis]|uniref:Uncharacterized protein LOC112904456 isoform X2 n=1 Tax=Agrilus planipennis TaxID=224129 RepID=A0A7F5R4H4_AGRPL|nr:uncharacterized protein LOC112904456 isoform X2 [Agrilus planipennis]
MKILLLRIFLLYVLFCLSEIESVDIIGGKSDDGPPGVCYLKKIKLEIPDKGYVYKGCNLYTCQYPDYVKYGCPSIKIKGPNGKLCTPAKDLTKPYPDCCNSGKCA